MPNTRGPFRCTHRSNSAPGLGRLSAPASACRISVWRGRFWLATVTPPLTRPLSRPPATGAYTPFASPRSTTNPPDQIALACPLGRIAPRARRRPDAGVQQLREVDVLATRVRVEALEHVKPHVPDVHARAHGAERRARKRRAAQRIEILPPPLRAGPHPHEIAAGRVRREAGRDADAEDAALDRVGDAVP